MTFVQNHHYQGLGMTLLFKIFTEEYLQTKNDLR